MTRVSLRYFYPLSACLLVALIPVVVHSYLRLEVDDCKARPSFMLDSARASDVKRDAWMRERFQSSQQEEGTFIKDGLRFDFSIIRSYDAKRLYHRPENSLVEHALVKSRAIEFVPADSGELPIHRADYADTNPAILAAYLLVYRSSPVANPYWAQLRAAPVELFSGRHPMTLFFIQARGPQQSIGQIEKAEREWLLASWKEYGSACTQ